MPILVKLCQQNLWKTPPSRTTTLRLRSATETAQTCAQTSSNLLPDFAPQKRIEKAHGVLARFRMREALRNSRTGAYNLCSPVAWVVPEICMIPEGAALTSRMFGFLHSHQEPRHVAIHTIDGHGSRFSVRLALIKFGVSNPS